MLDEGARARLTEAVRFALDVHAQQTRKGTTVPYASHLLQVAGLVMEHGGDVEQAVAAVLHDAVEDGEAVTPETLSERFGSEVARIVVLCTDLLPGDRPHQKSDWTARKTRYVARLAEADRRTRLVAACDKLHNLRTLVADLHAEGPATLGRFNAAPAQTRGYHEAVRRALGEELPERLLRELDALLAELARFVPEARFDAP